MSVRYPGTKVETKGFSARHYDAFMNVITLGRYPSFIEESIRLIGVKPEDKIIDFGAGTGRNARLMLKHLSPKGKLMGVDISEAMISQFKKKCAHFANAKIINARIDEPLSFKEEFDKVFISFVLHGFPQNARETITDNAYQALKSNGEFHILDWNEFDLNALPFHQRTFFKLIECPYAFDFIERDWKKILREKGFTDFEEHFFFAKFIRLLKARKIAS
ncbi:MAG: class I SAM-dependent methyltransferase [Candidatus Omnitrophica bacterium]|nr:class I SAM-dependent methyltransferase [Candidatus Omnitrophota bacterium]